MRQPLVIAVLSATLLTFGVVAVLSAQTMTGWTPHWAGQTPPVPSAPPTVAVPDASQSNDLQVGVAEGNVTVEQIEQAWNPVVESAQEEMWEPWVLVVDADTGETLFDRDGQVPHTLASLMKIVTAYFALTTLDPQEHLKTGVSQSGTDLYFWGEGDLLLSADAGSKSKVNGRAGLADLAAQVSENVSGKERTFSLHYQDTLFDGPLRAPELEEQEVIEWVGDVGPYAINSGRSPEDEHLHIEGSAVATAEMLKNLLQKRGVTVADTTTFDSPLPTGAKTVGTIESATVLEQIQRMLEVSDNTLAEQYCLISATKILGKPANMSQVTAMVAKFLKKEGIRSSNLVIADCSGLNENSKIEPQTIVDIMSVSATADSNAASLTRILPVGGLSGTLSSRFTEHETAGNIVGKTGSLGHVSALAGLGTTVSGQHLYIAVGADNVPSGGTWHIVPVIDQFFTDMLLY